MPQGHQLMLVDIVIGTLLHLRKRLSFAMPSCPLGCDLAPSPFVGNSQSPNIAVEDDEEHVQKFQGNPV